MSGRLVLALGLTWAGGFLLGAAMTYEWWLREQRKREARAETEWRHITRPRPVP